MNTTADAGKVVLAVAKATPDDSIQGIKIVRNALGLGLREAKTLYDYAKTEVANARSAIEDIVLIRDRAASKLTDALCEPVFTLATKAISAIDDLVALRIANKIREL